MKITFGKHAVDVTRESGEDVPVANESAFWHQLKLSLRKRGYDVIKKLMSKDGHMVDDSIYYVRSRNMAKPGAFAIWDDQYAVRNVAKDFNSGKPVTLKLQTNPKVANNPGSDDAVLWVRFGDADEYQEFGDDISALASAFVENEVDGSEIKRRPPGGVTAPGYGGQNYISLFWGDADANFVRELTAKELAALKSEMHK